MVDILLEFDLSDSIISGVHIILLPKSWITSNDFKFVI